MKPDDPLVLREPATPYWTIFSQYSGVKMTRQDLVSLQQDLSEKLDEMVNKHSLKVDDPLPEPLEARIKGRVAFVMMQNSKKLIFAAPAAEEVIDNLETYAKAWSSDEGPLSCDIEVKISGEKGLESIAIGRLKTLAGPDDALNLTAVT